MNKLVLGATFVLLTALLGSSSLYAQDRRHRDRDDSSRRAFTTYRGVFRGLSLNPTRMGVSVDPHQPTRYDETGARLTWVTHRSLAGDAGLEEGDIVTAINGQSLTSRLSTEVEEDFDRNESLPAQRLIAIARTLDPGDPLQVDFVRDGESQSVSFEAEEDRGGWMVSGRAPDVLFGWNDDGESRVLFESRLHDMTVRAGEVGRRALEQAEGMLRGITSRNLLIGDADFWGMGSGIGQCPPGVHTFARENSGCVAGVEIREITAGLGSYFQVDGGLLVMDAAGENPLGLKVGDVILEIGGREISSLRRLRRLVGSYEPGETITLTVMRAGNRVDLEGVLD